jgi:hypothetical protein
MESPGHRAKILDLSYWETGAGYWAGGSEGHYWVEDFGRRRGFFPVVIDGEARSTPTRDVRLHVYGTWREMRLRNDDGPSGPWRPFTGSLDWQLAEGAGRRTVTVGLRDVQRHDPARLPATDIGTSAGRAPRPPSTLHPQVDGGPPDGVRSWRASSRSCSSPPSKGRWTRSRWTDRRASVGAPGRPRSDGC